MTREEKNINPEEDALLPPLLHGGGREQVRRKTISFNNHPDLASSFHTGMQVNWLLLFSQR